MRTFVVADIGGTQIRAAVFQSGNPKPVTVKKIRTIDKQLSPVDRMISLIKEVWPQDAEVSAIVVAVPGYMDIKKGLVVEAPNIPGWINLPIQKLLAEHFTAPIHLGNDANIAALGEWRYGAGIGHNNLLYMTISTGIGGGAIINGQLMAGQRGLAGEFGHFTVVPNGPLCGCGHRGHLEAVASGTAIARFTAERIAQGAKTSLAANPHPSAKDVAKAAAAGDELSMQMFNQAGTYIGHTLADYLHIFNPSIVILGGGVMGAGALILDPIINALDEAILGRPYLENIQVVPALLGDDAGLIGGLVLAETFYPE